MSADPPVRLPAGQTDLAAALGDPALRAALAAQLPDWLRARRWFGGQTRQIASVDVVGWVPLPDGVILALITVSDVSGDTSRHPLLLAATPDGAVRDGLELPEIRSYLLEQLLAGATLQGERLRIVGMPLGATPAIDTGTSRVVGVEQSNTSIIYGDRAIVKVYRRLVAGPNPEVELGRYLTEAGFAAVPRLFATAQLVGQDGFVADLLVLQEFVSNDGDGWAWAVAAAKRALAATKTPEALVAWLNAEKTTFDHAAALGETTAQLHATLAAAKGDDLSPQPVTADDRAAWLATLRREADATLAALDRRGHSDQALRTAVAAAGRLTLADVAHGGLRIRVHGDYHLGQVLLGQGSHGTQGWVILDFEGEPARSLAERRRRQSPLVDVAGMVRSWGYAAHSASAELGTATAALAERWEATVRARFLAAYWAAAGRATVPFLPPAAIDRAALLRVFEVQKALYEVRYEINNRPDWLHIPAGAVRRLM